jgi:putative membrane protein
MPGGRGGEGFNFGVAAGRRGRMVRGMKSPLLGLILRWLVLALGVALAARIVPGIHYADAETLFLVVVLLSFFNAVLRPLLVLFTLPFILLSLGLGLVVINAWLFMLVGKLVTGFTVDGFWSAFFGAAIVGVTNFAMSRLIGRPPGGTGSGGGSGGGGKRPARRETGGDVIDV